jgi:hypothetical protein
MAARWIWWVRPLVWTVVLIGLSGFALAWLAGLGLERWNRWRKI